MEEESDKKPKSHSVKRSSIKQPARELLASFALFDAWKKMAENAVAAHDAQRANIPSEIPKLIAELTDQLHASVNSQIQYFVNVDDLDTVKNMLGELRESTHNRTVIDEKIAICDQIKALRNRTYKPPQLGPVMPQLQGDIPALRAYMHWAKALEFASSNSQPSRAQVMQLRNTPDALRDIAGIFEKFPEDMQYDLLRTHCKGMSLAGLREQMRQLPDSMAAQSLQQLADERTRRR